MQGEAWATVGTGLTVLGGMFAVWWSNRSQNHSIETKVDTAAIVAAEAAENTKAVSNGFADRTTGGIDDVKAMVAEVREAQRQLIEISGRTVGRLDQVIARQDRADARFTDHLSDHLRQLREMPPGE